MVDGKRQKQKETETEIRYHSRAAARMMSQENVKGNQSKEGGGVERKDGGKEERKKRQRLFYSVCSIASVDRET